MPVAKDIQCAVRKILAKQANCGQREDEVAQGSAADHENAARHWRESGPIEFPEFERRVRPDLPKWPVYSRGGFRPPPEQLAFPRPARSQQD